MFFGLELLGKKERAQIQGRLKIKTDLFFYIKKPRPFETGLGIGEAINQLPSLSRSQRALCDASHKTISCDNHPANQRGYRLDRLDSE